jgi:hypothetical protein
MRKSSATVDVINQMSAAYRLLLLSEWLASGF